MAHERPGPDLALAAVLRAKRDAQGMTIEDLAFRSRVSLGAVSKIERGKVAPSWPTALQIARALGLTAGELGALVDAERNGSP